VLYIILAILSGVFVLCVFKLFDRFGISTAGAIIVNYLAAGLTGYFCSGHHESFFDLAGKTWLWYCIPLGFLFYSVFYLMSVTIQKISVAACSVENKMSVVMPVLFSVLFVGETLDFLKGTGILLALVAVYFATKQNDPSNSSRNLIWLPVIVFVGSGLIDISINAAKTYYLITPGDNELFTICSFLSAFVFGLISVPFKKNFHLNVRFDIKTIAAGIILGIPNYFSIFLIIKSMETGVLKTAQLFPVLNISNVTLSSIIGFTLFKEKLNRMNWFGIALAVVSILLIAL